MIREVELKYRFPSQQSYLALLNSIEGEHRIEHQTNSFFDTPDLRLKSQHIFLRLRKSNDQHIFTCKAAPENMNKPSGLLSVHDEWEQIVPGPEIDPIGLLHQTWPDESKNAHDTRLSLLRRIETLIKSQPVSLVGSFKNKRTHVPYSIGGHKVDLEFDETDFGNGQLDYELEIELPEGLAPQIAEAELAKLLTHLQIETGPSTGKAERFFGLKAHLGLSG